VSAIPDPVDLAIIVVPREEVLGVVDDCGKKGVKGLVVITAGYSETGEKGRRFEAELGERVRRYGMRMIGPNCMGVINTDPAVRMDATFAPTLPLTGRRCVDLIVTDMAVIEVIEDGLLVREIAPDTTLEAVRKATGTKLRVAPALKKCFPRNQLQSSVSEFTRNLSCGITQQELAPNSEYPPDRVIRGM
jgi:hypothetical protein